MIKSPANPLPVLVQRFFSEHLLAERQLSPCTLASYRDAFRLLLAYLHQKTGRNPSRQRLEDFDAPGILGFLSHLETQRHCGAQNKSAKVF